VSRPRPPIVTGWLLREQAEVADPLKPEAKL